MLSETEREQRIRWLVDQGRQLLDLEPAIDSTGLRLEPWQKAMLTEQQTLQKRSRRRFPVPEKWLWTERSLSQASDWWSAQFKARLFPEHVEVIDGCCGAGVDLVALAGRCQVVGIDQDLMLTQLAAANLATHAGHGQVRAERMDDCLLDRQRWLHVDPDRRSNGRRTTAADDFSPPIEEVLAWLPRCPGAVIKVAPNTEFSAVSLAQIESSCQRLWLGNQGECRQQLLLSGKTRDSLQALTGCGAADRIAVLAEPKEAPEERSEVEPHWFAASSAIEVPVIGDVQAYVFDLHHVLHAAGLHRAWAEQAGLQAVGHPQGYYTSNDASLARSSPWLQCFQVVDVLAWDDRRVRRSLREQHVGPVEVKNRLLRLDANYYQRRYTRAEGEAMTLLVTRLGRRTRAILARRV